MIYMIFQRVFHHFHINATGIIANEKIFRQRRPFKQNIIYGKKYQYKY